MKPFDLKQALAGKPVCTRDGRPVKIGGYNPSASITTQIIGWIEDMDITLTSWGVSGRFVEGAECNEDLFLVGERRKGWIRLVMSPEGPRPIPTKVYASQTEAELAAAGDYPGKAFPEQVIQIEWED